MVLHFSPPSAASGHVELPQSSTPQPPSLLPRKSTNYWAGYDFQILRFQNFASIVGMICAGRVPRRWADRSPKEYELLGGLWFSNLALPEFC